MLLEHFGLSEQPFGVTPDPRFLHLSAQHREALATLMYCTEANRGFVALIAPPGMGKTSLLFRFLEGQRDRVRTAYIFHNARDERELMRYLLADLGIESRSDDLPGMHQKLQRLMLQEMEAGRRMVLVVDEAQNLDARVLESIRLLSNFETPWVKLVQIVLAGQPQLAEVLARPALAQLRQRISSVVRIDPFAAEESHAYIDHRLWVAGYSGPKLFTPDALVRIARESDGIPRKINNICFHAISLAYATGQKQVGAEMVQEVVDDLAIGRSTSDPLSRSARANSKSTVERSVVVNPHVLFPPPTVRPSRLVAASISIVLLLLLGVVSGASWKTAASSQPLDVTPSVEAATFGESPVPLAPEATTPAASPMARSGEPETASPSRIASLTENNQTSPLTNEVEGAFHSRRTRTMAERTRESKRARVAGQK